MLKESQRKKIRTLYFLYTLDKMCIHSYSAAVENIMSNDGFSG